MAELFPPAHINLGTPDWGFKQSPDVNADVISLGDGYEFRALVGLNAVRKNFSPTYSNLSPEDGEAAYDYLEPLVKTKSVLWQHPINGKIYKVIPDAISLTWDDVGNAVLDISWRQDFNPG